MFKKYIKEIKLDRVFIAILALMMLYVTYDIIMYKKEGFCGNLFGKNCNPSCPQDFISYALPGIQSRNKRMSVNLKNLKLDDIKQKKQKNVIFKRHKKPAYAITTDIKYPATPRVERYIDAY